LITVLTLAIAIGANTAIFSIMDGLLLRSLPVNDPHHHACDVERSRQTQLP
jgi:hypothetical protein